VLVSDWNQFQALKQALVGTGKFNSTRQTQRLMYEDEFPVDIVPFGGIAQDEGSISWPPEYVYKGQVFAWVLIEDPIGYRTELAVNCKLTQG